MVPSSESALPVDQRPAEGRRARGVMVPSGPTAEEREEHCLTHVWFRAWCSACVKGRAPDDPHHRSGEPSVLAAGSQRPMLQADYTFLSSVAAVSTNVEALYTIFNVLYVDMGLTLPIPAGDKGPIEYCIKAFCENVNEWGVKELILRVDGEPAIK
eukprot:4360182-Lingulodinium_polyedra.AAC.1